MDTTQTRIPTVASADERLAVLLEAELAFDPVARGGYINHTAMALTAAWRLGADADRLGEWYHADATSDFLIPRQAPPGLADVRAEVAAAGIEAAVRRAAPALVASPGSQFFHAAIRLEYAVDAGSPAQVANAIHNWRRHPDQPEGPPGEVDADRHGTALLDRVAAEALAAHVRGADITTLHLVTGTRAARALAPLLDPADVEVLALRTAEAVRTIGHRSLRDPLPDRDELDGLRARPLPSWDAVATAAIASGDPHVVKLAYTCWREHQASGDDLYRWVAAREAGLSRAG